MVKNPATNAGEIGLILGSGKSPGGGNGNPFQDSCLENPMHRGAEQATCSPWGQKELDTTEQLSTRRYIKHNKVAQIKRRFKKKEKNTEKSIQQR